MSDNRTWMNAGLGSPMGPGVQVPEAAEGSFGAMGGRPQNPNRASAMMHHPTQPLMPPTAQGLRPPGMPRPGQAGMPTPRPQTPQLPPGKRS